MKKLFALALAVLLLVALSACAPKAYLGNNACLIYGQHLTDKQLKKLIENGKISDSIVSLDLSHNRIHDLGPLRSLTNLRYLYLTDNQISDLSPLSSLTNLQALYLNYNQISDLTPLQSLTNLSYLWISDNRISDLTPLQSLVNLSDLAMNDNQISDLSPLKSLTKLTYLTKGGNPLAQQQIDDMQAALPNCRMFE